MAIADPSTFFETSAEVDCSSVVADWLVGGGEMGKLVRSMDWSKTPLGAIETWPQSLRTTVSLCLSSSFPIVLAWGPQHVQIYNDGYRPICGARHPESMGQNFSECWKSAWPVIRDAFESALTGQTRYLENLRMFVDRNGYLEETFFTFSFSPVRDEAGHVGGLFDPAVETTSKMLSERRSRALRDLAARTSRVQTTQEAFSSVAQTLGSFDLDLPFVLLYTIDAEKNEARLVASTGWMPATTTVPEAMPTDQPTGPWPFAEVLRDGKAVRIDDLQSRLGEFSCGPYPEAPKTAILLPIVPPGHDRALVVLIAGVSTRLPFNEEYRGFCDQLAATFTAGLANAMAYEEQHRRAETLAELDRAKIDFFSNVSHEFRTPLMLMLGPLEDALQEDGMRSELRERLEVAHRNSLRLLKLVNTLLEFSRFESGRVDASFEPTDLAVHTADLASIFRSAIENAGLIFQVDCQPLPEPVYVDREMWEKVVLNLLSNAFKFTEHGEITVRQQIVGASVELAVADTGVGIPANQLDDVFKRFHRVEGSRGRTHEGTGIGLALVQEFTKLHGGLVRVESTPGHGSRFTVSIPLGKQHLPRQRIGPERPLPTKTASADAFVDATLHWRPAARYVKPANEAGYQPQVLLADDNADMREYVRKILADHYEVHAVADGQLALAAALEHSFDLVLSDVMMPGMDGFTLLGKLRSHPKTKTVPVILVSARAGEESRVGGLLAGADDYLVKPFSGKELLARVQTHLKMAKLRDAWARELELANKELETFSYSVSHDLQAAVHTIDGFSRRIREAQGDKLDEQTRRELDFVCSAAQRMRLLIDDLLTLSRITQSPLDRVLVDISALARRVFCFIAEADDPARRVDFSVSEGLVANADARLLVVLFENLLGNARKFTGKKRLPKIEIGKVCRENEEVFFVRDNGAGFDMESAQKLFSPFQRLHADTEFQGNGIGLATVARIIQRHGGRIWAEAAKGIGATFFFTLGTAP
jgi:signal transduction histidine kinase